MAQSFAGPIVPDLPGIEDLQAVGRGGFATVYRGWQPAFQRAVAVKILDNGPGAPGISRFQKEVRALGSLSGHRHVVAVYDAGVIDGRPYLIMPFLSGGSLDERLRNGPLPADEIAPLGAAIADALAAAHHLGILHRDIKPSNILASAYGELQLADFGIARFADSTTTNGKLTATVSYAAPEVLSGAPATPASDIYSLGATLYTAVRGTPAFAARQGESLLGLAVRAMTGSPDDLRHAGVNPALADIIARATAKDPADRYPSAAELRNALQSLQLEPVGRSAQIDNHNGTSPAAQLVEAANPAASRPPTAPEPAPAPVAAFEAAAPSPPQEVGATEPADPTDVAAPMVPPSPPPILVPPTAEARRPAPPPPLPTEVGAPPQHRLQHPLPAPPGPRVAPYPRRRRPLVLAALAVVVIGVLTAIVLNRRAAQPSSSHTNPPPTVSGAPASSAPTTTARSGTGPSTGAATVTAPTPGASSADITQNVDNYYALVNQHQLDQSFGWLSPAYQQRIGFSNYKQFWNSITQISVLGVTPGSNSATLSLRYVGSNGTTSTEHAAITFVHDASGKLLIDTYRSF